MTATNRDEPIRVLVVDDDEGFRDALTARLKRRGHEVVATESPRDALAMATADRFSVALVDLKMPEMDGITLLKELKSPASSLEVIVLTGHATVETAIEAMKLGAYDYLTKPFEGAKLDVILEKAYEKARLARHAQLLESEVERLNRELKERYSFQSLIGRSRPMQDLYDRITSASKTRGNIMILGESGTGKELVARAIHFTGPDAAHPFVPVNCAALPHELIESELFGYRKGTFTGANADSPGLFKAAERGTIFLDEITEMSADTQAKLLRVLQEKAIRPVGSTKEVGVNVRVIASTNRDPSHAVAQGKFREDLYYRLAVAPIRIPPLRERADDVPLLVHHFIQKLNQVYERQVSGVDKAALEVLVKYRWPGNVRELENVIEAAYTFGKTAQVTTADLPPNLARDRNPKTDGLPFEGVMPLSEAERMLIIRAMSVFKGNKSHVARALEISRKQLYVKLTTYGIHGPKHAAEETAEDDDEIMG